LLRSNPVVGLQRLFAQKAMDFTVRAQSAHPATATAFASIARPSHRLSRRCSASLRSDATRSSLRSTSRCTSR
jgi:hypothetical protein